ncbi:hypothetical protein PAEPH01_0748 [Pancytospora epiphaga]|nr:hypothetical protein PAEPH01_0748 [Pancytospora epiphaga]
MIWRNLYERFKDQVLRQEIDGSYKTRSAFNNWMVLGVLGIFCMVLGGISLGIYIRLQTQTINYNSNTKRRIFLTEGTYYMYIEIEQLFQNNLSYSKSINYDQIGGKTKDLNLSDCKPYDYKDGKAYYPAGLIANTYFQDIIRIEGIEIRETGISWKRENDIVKKTAYKADEIEIPESWTPETNRGSAPLNTSEGSGLPILNERFVNWMNLSMFPHFRKLWGVMEIPKAGYYELEIESIFDLSGKKLYLTNKSWLGMRNYLLSAGLILIGIVSILLSALLRRMTITAD